MGLSACFLLSHCVREAFHPTNLPNTVGNAGANFITNAGRRAMSTEITSLAILVMDGEGKGKLGMITTFCRSDQAKVEHSDTLTTIVLPDSPKPGVVVTKVFTNSPYLSQGSFCSPYLDVTTIPMGALSTQFPLALLHLHSLLPYSPTQVILP